MPAAGGPRRLAAGMVGPVPAGLKHSRLGGDSQSSRPLTAAPHLDMG